MLELADRSSAPEAPHTPLTTPATDSERAARTELRRQIAELERRRLDIGAPAPPPRRRDAHLLTLAELERQRDALVETVTAARQPGAEQPAARARLEAMILAPQRHRYARVTLEELGQPGCGAYECRPRLGLIGMLAGWWQVKLSSGCP